MKILSAEKIREADAYTIENEPIKSIDLMERAAQAFVNWFVKEYDSNTGVLCVAGPGNNGGDALAIARMLSKRSYNARVLLASPNAEGSRDYQMNLRRLPRDVKRIDSVSETRSKIIVDGIFGSGLARPIEGNLAKLVDEINNSGKKIVSVDIASGLSCDGHALGEHVIMPDHTVTFQLPKLAFMFPENAAFVGQWTAIPIGLDSEFISAQQSQFHFQVDKEIKEVISPRKKFAHKGTFGHALLIGGSYGKIGAITLASKACLRSGAGKVTTLLPKCGYGIIQTSVPEVMCMTSGEDYLEGFSMETIKEFSAIGLGPGMSITQSILSLFTNIIKAIKQPIVIDADGLNLLAENKELLEMLPAQSILTPHVGEFNRLAHPTSSGIERVELQRAFSKKYNVIVVLKGAHTTISDTEGNIWFNSTGNPGMATAGSGDALTGMITGLLAQGYNPLEASRIGVFMHGRAGDLAKQELGEISIMASDIVERISSAFISI
ncbi:MAG: NAD(P)H-hydrate dehydratase [Cyclobacteriaceae bacterium]|nr:NAD(P)H-hydrate dehydratase [Cyclobacteriaceae bacterium]